MERVGSRHDLLLQHASSPCASNSSLSSPRCETLAIGEEGGVETMQAGGGSGGGLSAAENGKQKADDADLPGAGGLSAAEKGKQKADDGDSIPGAGAGVLRPALGLRHALFPSATTEIEEAPPSPPPPSSHLLALSLLERNQATVDRLQAELQQLRCGLGVGEGSSSKCLQGGEPRPGDEARWCAGAGAGVPRHPLGPSAAASDEIEEAPPSPAPLCPRLLAMNAATSGPAASLAEELERKRAALVLMVSQLQQERRERGVEGRSRRPEGEPRQDAAGAAAGIATLEHELGMMHERLSSWRDRMVALRLQEEEMRAFKEAWEEFWKPVPVPQRKNSKIGGTCNWKRIISAITFATGLVLLIQFRTLLPLLYLTHIVGAIISVLWVLGTSIAFCRQLFGTSRTIKGFSRHVARLLCVCFLILVLYVLYLVLCLLGGTFTGLLGKRP